MTIVYFVRHAQSDADWADDFSRPLTAAGAQDRFAVMEFLKDKQVDSLYSSPYVRAMETLRPIAEEIEAGIEADYRLRERESGLDAMSPGNLERRWTDHSYAETGGESLRSVQERNIECLHEILGNEEDKRTVIGTHGTALSTIWNYYDRSFGIRAFLGLLDLMPCVVRFSFEGNRLVEIQKEFGIRKKYEGKNCVLESYRANAMGDHGKETAIASGSGFASGREREIAALTGAKARAENDEDPIPME